MGANGTHRPVGPAGGWCRCGERWGGGGVDGGSVGRWVPSAGFEPAPGRGWVVPMRGASDGGCPRQDSNLRTRLGGWVVPMRGASDGGCPRQDSNLRTRLRRPMLYPLSYEGGGCRILGRKLGVPGGPAACSGAAGPLAPVGRRRSCVAVRGLLGRARRPGRSAVSGRATGGEFGRRCRWWRWRARPLTMRAKPRRLRCWRAWPMLWARPSQRVSSRLRLMRFGVVAAGVEPGEVGVAGWDGPDVLGAVELPGGVVVVAVEPDGDGLVAVVGRGAGSRCTSGTCRSCRGCGGCGRGGVR